MNKTESKVKLYQIPNSEGCFIRLRQGECHERSATQFTELYLLTPHLKPMIYFQTYNPSKEWFIQCMEKMILKSAKIIEQNKAIIDQCNGIISNGMEAMLAVLEDNTED